jgi:hypothetical protein
MKVNILGHEYEVFFIKESEVPEELKEKLTPNDGLCENYSQELFVLKHDPSPDHYKRPDLYQKRVGKHEMFHGYFHKSGISQLVTTEAEELIVDFLATNLDQIYENAKTIEKFIENHK